MHTPSRRSHQNPESSKKYNTRCVCQICTCGKHHCPKKVGSRFEGVSAYHRDYVPYEIGSSKRQPCQHHYQERHYDPELMKSSYQQFYTPYKIEAQKEHKKCEYRPRTAQFYDQTEYKESYDKKQVAVDPAGQNRCNGVHYQPNRAKFEGTTTYGAEFVPKQTDPKGDYAPKHYERRKVPFEGKSTYNTEFIPHQQERENVDSRCNHSHYQPRKARFEGESHYKQDYKGYVIDPEERCPIIDLPSYPRECSPGKTHVNFSADKNKWD